MIHDSKSTLICDLDNTLYDWVGYFVESFYAMVEEAARILECDKESLLDNFRAVHQKHNDSEHPFALLETEVVRSKYQSGIKRAIRDLDPAFHAFNSRRKETLYLYPGVIETLAVLKRAKFKIVGHTESKFHAVVDRTRRLGLIQLFDRIYCRERAQSDHPGNMSMESWLADFPTDRIVELSHHQRKPDPDVLLEIIARENSTSESSAYVGDSIARDVLMAKRANVTSIWAAYGTFHDEALYRKLVRVTHWTPDDVARETRLREEARAIRPDYVLKNGFSEVLNVFRIDASEAPVRYIRL